MVGNAEKRAIRVIVRSRPSESVGKHSNGKRPSCFIGEGVAPDTSSSSKPSLQLLSETARIRYFPNGEGQGDCQQYQFDAVVDGDRLTASHRQGSTSRRSGDMTHDGNSNQAAFYTSHCAPSIRESLLKGYSSCLFAYGQTSAGKTYTMLGEEASNRLASRGRNLGISSASITTHSDVLSVECESSTSSYEEPLATPLQSALVVENVQEEVSGPESNCGPKEGVIPRALDEIFCLSKALEKEKGISSTISVSCLEVYKERITDLLNPLSEVVDAGVARRLSESLRLRGRRVPNSGVGASSDSDMEWYVENLYSTECDSHVDAMKQLRGCIARRRIRSHSLNISSSRSHLVFTIHVRQEWGNGAHVAVDECSKGGRNPCEALGDLNFPEELRFRSLEINFVDLAGSEKLNLITVGMNGSALSTTHLIEESITINQSLFTLGRVISALADGAAHVPYRESKLTMLLKPALGGQAAATMIACIRPAAVDESMSTLLYASRAKKISNEVRQNIDPQTALVLALKKEVESLKKQLSDTRSELATAKQQQPLEFLYQGESEHSTLGLLELGASSPAKAASGDCNLIDDLAGKLLGTSIRLAKALEVNAKLRKAFDWCQRSLEVSRQKQQQQEAQARYWMTRSKALSGLLGFESESEGDDQAAAAAHVDGSAPPLREGEGLGERVGDGLNHGESGGTWDFVGFGHDAASAELTARSARSESSSSSMRRRAEKTPRPPSQSKQGLMNQCLARQLEGLRNKKHRTGGAPKAAFSSDFPVVDG